MKNLLVPACPVALVLLGTSALPPASAAPQATPTLRETLAVLTGIEPEMRALPSFPGLPRRVSAGFGVVPTRVVPSASARGSLGLRAAARRVIPACGPSMAVNTLVCNSIAGGQMIDEIPMPGTVSTTPIFYEGSWLAGTSEGFFVRFVRAGGGQESPSFHSSELLSFWGGEARTAMSRYRPSTLAATSTTAPLPADWRWAFAAGAEFTGTPVVGDGAVFVTASNQYLYALAWDTGKVLWTLRLAPDTNLRLSSAALELSTNRKEVLVGTSEGILLGLSPQNGQVLWRHRISSGASERFPGIVARPLSIERSVIVSNAEGSTYRLALDRCQSAGTAGRCGVEERAVEWTYASGSVASPALVGGTSVAIGGTDGSLALLDLKTGALIWKLGLFRNLPIVAVAGIRTEAGESIVAASAEGELAMVSGAGVVQAHLPGAGEPVGEFLPGQDATEVCLSYSHAGFRCFSTLPH